MTKETVSKIMAYMATHHYWLLASKVGGGFDIDEHTCDSGWFQLLLAQSDQIHTEEKGIKD